MIKKPIREFLSLQEFSIKYPARPEIEVRALYMEYLQWYRDEMSIYRSKIKLVNSALAKLTRDEIEILRMYWK